VDAEAVRDMLTLTAAHADPCAIRLPVLALAVFVPPVRFVGGGADLSGSALMVSLDFLLSCSSSTDELILRFLLPLPLPLPLFSPQLGIPPFLILLASSFFAFDLATAAAYSSEVAMDHMPPLPPPPLCLSLLIFTNASFTVNACRKLAFFVVTVLGLRANDKFQSSFSGNEPALARTTNATKFAGAFAGWAAPEGGAIPGSLIGVRDSSVKPRCWRAGAQAAANPCGSVASADSSAFVQKAGAGNLAFKSGSTSADFPGSSLAWFSFQKRVQNIVSR